MPVDTKYIEAVALDYANVPKIDRSIIASIHLENRSDEVFWDKMLLHNQNGKYNFIYESRKEKDGSLISGVDQCLRYKPFLCKTFFVCIDSDWRYLLQEPNIDAEHYILQTYTYSWENHYCIAQELQKRLASLSSEAAKKFDFESFVHELSRLAFEPLLYLLEAIKMRLTTRNVEGKFQACFPSQCSASVFDDNGEQILSQITQELHQFVQNLSSVPIDIGAAKEKYAKFMLREDNTYLFLRGHNIWGLLNSIGNMLCRPYRINFKEQILLPSLQLSGYWQMEKIHQDIRSLIC